MAQTFFRRFLAYAVIAYLPVAAGCSTERSEAPGPPDGWRADKTLWWTSGTDTAGVLASAREVSELEMPGDSTFFAARPDDRMLRSQILARVREDLMPLIRTNPHIVDSLYGAEVAPGLIPKDVLLDGSREEVERLKRKAYKQLHRHYREPVPVSKVGDDVQISYPDSLRNRKGAVVTQVYLDAAGKPRAVLLLESVHPVLDTIALKATTEMLWNPAYVYRGGEWVPIPAWVRRRIIFS